MIRIEVSESKRVADILSCYVSFPYDRDWVEFFRSSNTRFYHTEGEHAKCWEVPSSRLSAIIEKAKLNGDEVELNWKNFKDNSVRTVPSEYKFVTEPFNHQLDGFLFGLSNDSFILADEQGLGKTKQIIDIACCLKAQGKIKKALIICCDNSLKWNWKREISIHSKESCRILGSRYTKREKKLYIGSNKDRLEDLENIEKIEEFFLITNVETLRYCEKVPVGKPKADGSYRKIKKFLISDKLNELQKSGEIGLIAIDEIHMAKNPNSLQGEGLLNLSGGCRIIPMTGTPILNSPLDCYIPMKLIGVEKDNYGLFTWRYSVKDNFGGISGWRNMEQLHEIISGHMLRRLKSDVLDLPPKINQVCYVEMTENQQKIYDEVKEDIKKNIDKVRVSNNPLAELIRLRQATGWTGILSSKIQESAKLDRLEQICDEVVGSGGKVIVFSNWTQITNPVRERLSRFNPAYITGEVDDESRQKEVDRFQSDDSVKVCIGSVAAMGRGKTLTASQTCVFMDEPWNQGTKDQCSDRIHRIGTTGTVNIITLLTVGTIDERIHQIVEEKGEIADLLVDGKLPKKDKDDLIDFLLS